MTINFYQTNHFFENRLYISTLTKSKIKSNIHSEHGEEFSGAGVRSYSKPIGWVLSFFGLSSKLNIGDESFYINNKSFSKFIIRQSEREAVNSVHEEAKKLNDIFIDYKKSGYNKNKVNVVNNRLKQLLENNEIKDIFQMILDLRKVALDAGHSC